MLIATSLLVIAICAIFASAVSWVIKARAFEKKSNYIPGPTPIPIVGNLLLNYQLGLETLKVTRYMRKYGDMVRYWMGPYPCVSIESAELFQIAFSSPALLSRPPQTHVMEQILGVGNVLSSSGDVWKKARSAMSQAFYALSYTDIWKTLLKRADYLVDDLNENVGSDFFQCAPVLRKYYFSIVADVSLTEGLAYPASELADVFQYLLECFELRILSPLHYSDITFNFTEEGKKYKIMREKVEKFALSVLDAANKEREEYAGTGDEPPNRFMQNLLQKNSSESVEFLKSQIITLFGTGVDTSVNTVTFTLLLLGLHPEAQQQLYEEDQAVQSILDDKPLEMADLNNHYPLLTSVIKESLRLFPIGPIISRYATEDVRFGKYVVPKGTIIFCDMIGTHRSERYYKEPMTFKADRFLPEFIEGIPVHARIPFGYGQRVCLGAKFAQLALKSTILAIIKNFKIYTKYKNFEELDSNTSGSLTLRDKNDGWIRLERR